MSIQVTCPQGHQIKVTDKEAGTAVRCPWCAATVDVPPLESDVANRGKPDTARVTQAPASSAGLMMSPAMLLVAGAIWAFTLLLAVMLGAFLANDAAEVQDGPQQLAMAPAESRPPSTDDTERLTPQSIEPPADIKPPPDIKPPADVEPAADIEPPTNVTVDPDISMAVEERPQSRSASLDSKAARELLIADIKEAIEMLEKKQYRLLTADFLPQEVNVAMQMQQRSRTSRTQRGLEMIPESVATDLLAHLKAALTAEMSFNRNGTLAEVQYVREPVEVVPDKPLEDAPQIADRPKDSAPGLGDDLPKMLRLAADMLKKGDTEQFVRSVYPLAELARLSEGDAMKRHLLRMAARPQMSAAMVRDLQAAAAEDIKVDGNQAEVTLEPPVKGDRERVVKFELVEGHWRFFDGGRGTRDQWRELVAKPIPGHTIPGSRGVMTFTRTGDNWRLHAMPISQPIEE